MTGFARRTSGTPLLVLSPRSVWHLSPSRGLVTLYAADPETAADSLGLRPAETGGNVVIARPFDPVVFERTESADGITYARVTQILLDLMTGPGRGPAEAEALLEWMRENEQDMEITADQRTISAREGLLDAVEALGAHGEAVILVGAQAIYVHTGEADALDLQFPPSRMTPTLRLILLCLATLRLFIDAMGGAGLQSDRPTRAVQKGERRTG